MKMSVLQVIFVGLFMILWFVGYVAIVAFMALTGYHPENTLAGFVSFMISLTFLFPGFIVFFHDNDDRKY